MLDFIVNKIAGGKHGKKIKECLARVEAKLKSLGVKYAVHFTEFKRGAIELTKKLIGKGATDIVVVGGDGTLHEVLNGFENFESVNLGLIPCGTGNDFASAVNIPTDPEKALDVILNEKPVYTDFMQMPSVRGMNVIGVGIDVAVLERYERLKRKTKFGYTKCLLKTLFKYKPDNFNATVDGDSKDYTSFIAAVANGKYFGGGIPICPVADDTDGKLNFIAVKGMGKLKLVRAFLKLKKGKILDLKQTIHIPMEDIKINLTKPYVVNVDGELYENIPFEVKIVKNTLKMYRPAMS